MRNGIGAAISLVVAGAAIVGGSAAAAAQGALMERSVSLQMARQAADGAIEQCAKDGYDVSVVVVDRQGLVRLLMRGDKAAPHNVDLARRKAYTARTFRRPSAEWAKRTATEPEIAPQRNLADVIALGGGVPINFGDDTIGAIGVSGAPGQDKDEACAKAGIAKIAELLK